jgi:hypothetical protein
MLIAAIIAFCVLLFLVALLAPRVSRYMERGGDAPLRGGQRVAGKAPGDAPFSSISMSCGCTATERQRSALIRRRDLAEHVSGAPQPAGFR